MTLQPEATTPVNKRIAWLGDAEISALRMQPDLCRPLFGHSALLMELQQLMQSNPALAQWYRPACVYAGDHQVAAGGFKGAPVRNTVEIGYRTHPQFRRQGHATSLVLWLCSKAEQQQLARVVAVASPDNVASQRVLEQAGFVNTGGFFNDKRQWLQRWQVSL